MDIPSLEHGCNSWIVTCLKTGKALVETRDKKKLMLLHPDKYRVETAGQYLARLNSELKVSNGTTR